MNIELTVLRCDMSLKHLKPTMRQVPDATLKEEVIDVLLPNQPDPRAPTIRKLFMEAWSRVAIDLKRQAEGPSDGVKKKMENPEREQRREGWVGRARLEVGAERVEVPHALGDGGGEIGVARGGRGRG